MATTARAKTPKLEMVAPDSLRVDRKFAKRLPEPDNIETLHEDWSKNGILVPLLATRDYLLLDGHSRLAFAKKAELKEVPVILLDIDGVEGWERTVSIIVNLDRRHYNEIQRAVLGTSLEKLERVKAKERQHEGQKAGGKAGGRGRPKVGANGKPQAKEKDRATTRVAKRVSVSRVTYERAKAVLKRAPKLAKQCLKGKLSISGAYIRLKRKETAEKTAAETKDREPGIFRKGLDKIPAAAYRTIYLDPPWQYNRTASQGAAERHYNTLSVEQLCALDVTRLAHPEGCHMWMWTTWPMIRDGAPHEILKAWGFRWTSEVVWRKPHGMGSWLRVTTEILILAMKGKAPLLSDPEPGFLEAARKKHSEKPAEARMLVERFSPGPRIELFGRKVPEGWDGWGNETRR